MKKYIITLFLVLLLIFIYTSQMANALTSDACAAILIDADTGKILYQYNSHKSLPNASTTKVLTALLALKYGDLDKEVTVPDDFCNAGETGLALKAGETHSLKDYMYAMLIDSANDAAQMVAYSVSGSEKEFIELMNQETAKIGLNDSSWQNPHGLHDDNHYSSAYDLAYITKEAMQYPLFCEIVSTMSWEMPWQSEIPGNIIYNRNKFFNYYEYSTGVKTGYTKQAGNCLIASASKDGMKLIGVILNCDDMYEDMAEMMDYGFDNFTRMLIAENGETFGSVKVNRGYVEEVEAVLDRDISLVFDNNLTGYNNDGKVNLKEEIEAPVTKGTVLGTVTYSDGEGNSVEGELLAAKDISRYTFWGVVKEVFRQIFTVLII